MSREHDGAGRYRAASPRPGRQPAPGAADRGDAASVTAQVVILCTQRPDADAVPGQLKANIPATVAFRVRGETNSRILLGEGNEAAAVLPPWPGRGIWQWDTQTQFQAPWLSPEQADQLLDAVRHPAFVGGAESVPPRPIRTGDHEVVAS